VSLSGEAQLRQTAECLGDRPDQHPAALVQRLDRERPVSRGQDQRWIDKAHVPAGVTAGKLEARRKQYAALLVEGVGESGIGGLVLATRDLALDADAASRLIADALHRISFRLRPAWSPGKPSRPK